MKRKDGLRIYFTSNKGYHYGPIEMKSMDDLEYLLHEHNDYDRYMIIETKNNSDIPVKTGDIEHVKKRKRNK